MKEKKRKKFFWCVTKTSIFKWVEYLSFTRKRPGRIPKVAAINTVKHFSVCEKQLSTNLLWLAPFSKPVGLVAILPTANATTDGSDC